jgi:hypothetical protein
MLAALILFLIGIFLIFVNPVLGLIPGILLILLSIVVFVLALLGRGIGAIFSIGSTKTCPDCKSKIPSDASVCSHCGYRYEEAR